MLRRAPASPNGSRQRKDEMEGQEDTSPHLLVDKRDGIAYVTLNRPEKRNAFSPEMLVRLCDAWSDIANDPSMRVVLRKMQNQV